MRGPAGPLPEQLARKTVCLILSGGNVAHDALRHLFRDGAP